MVPLAGIWDLFSAFTSFAYFAQLPRFPFLFPTFSLSPLLIALIRSARHLTFPVGLKRVSCFAVVLPRRRRGVDSLDRASPHFLFPARRPIPLNFPRGPGVPTTFPLGEWWVNLFLKK